MMRLLQVLTSLLSCIALNVHLYLEKKDSEIFLSSNFHVSVNTIDPLCGKQYPQPGHASQPDLGASVAFDTALWSCSSSSPRTLWSQTSKELEAVRWGLAKPFWTSTGLSEGSFVFLGGCYLYLGSFVY